MWPGRRGQVDDYLIIVLISGYKGNGFSQLTPYMLILKVISADSLPGASEYKYQGIWGPDGYHMKAATSNV